MKTTKVAKEIAKQIEARVNTYGNATEYERGTYHVEAVASGSEVCVRPLNGDTFYSLDRMIQVADFYGCSWYVTIRDNALAFIVYHCC